MFVGDISEGKPNPLGASFDGQGVNFALFSKHATGVDLCLFDEDGGERRVRMKARTQDVWHVYIDYLGPGQLYGYRVDGPSEPEQGHWFNPSKLLLDPYAKEIVGTPDWTGPLWYFEQREGKASDTVCHRDSAYAMPKARVIDRRLMDRSVSRPAIQPADTIIYEAHCRGMTMLNPDVPEAQRGKFLGLTAEPILKHLKQLGVTSVQLLPIQAAMDEHHLVKQGLSNYWRYNTLGFFAFESLYADKDGLKEVGMMVDRFHAAGIEVILDVVFNHTAEGDHNGPMLSFKGIDNASYYHLRPEDRRYYDNHTGCGNALNLAEPRVMQMVLDCLRFWAGGIGVDGFRFDLATTLGRRSDGFDGDHHFFAALRQDPILSEVKLIAEPWDVGPGGYQLGAFPAPFMEWNDRFRDTVRRFWRGDQAILPDLATRMLGSNDIFAPHGRTSVSSVNFLTAHDGFTLEDLVSFGRKHNEANGEDNRDGHAANFSRNHGQEGASSDRTIQRARHRQKMNLLATLFLSQGTPMLLAGDEFGNSQDGNNNAYCQDNEIGWVRWSRSQEDQQFQDFVCWVIAFRRQNPVLRQIASLPRSSDREPAITWFCPNGMPMTEEHWQVSWAKSVGLLLRDAHANDGLASKNAFASDSLLIALNASDEDQVFHTPLLQRDRGWALQIDTAASNGRPDHFTRIDAGGTFTLPAHSVHVLSAEPHRRHQVKYEASKGEILRRLGLLHGVELSYSDALGMQHDVTDECLRALLGSMGIEADEDVDVSACLGDAESNNCQRILRPVQVVRQGLPLTIEITLPADVKDERIRWGIQTEEGATYQCETCLSDLMAGHDRAVLGRQWRTFLLEVGTCLPIGYHHFSLELNDSKRAEMRLIVTPVRAFATGDLKAPRRHWGLLAPLYGLRSRQPTMIGDFLHLGQMAEALSKEGTSFIGVNPVTALNPTFPHQASPYSPSSRLHWHELLIGEEHDCASEADTSADLIDYAKVGPAKMKALWQRYRNMIEERRQEWLEFRRFCQERGEPLESFARFRALFESFYRQNPGEHWSWRHWPNAYRDPSSPEVTAFAVEQSERVGFYKYAQYLADRQLGDAQRKAQAGGMAIGLYLDLAVGIDPHGADCWANQACFAHGASLGAPPDAFNHQGQNWALAPFIPGELEKQAYQPFIELLRSSMRHAGALRIDHIIGLQRSFWIPDNAELGGAYVRYPIDDLLGIVALESHRQRCLVIGEDLGTLPDGLRERLESRHILSSRVMYFERGDHQAFRKSCDYPDQALATVGTHDLPSLAGFWQGRDLEVRASLGMGPAEQSSQRQEERRNDRLALLKCLKEEGLLPDDIDIDKPPEQATPSIVTAIHAFLAKTPCELVAVQLEDLLGAVEQANLPGTVDEHPNWRRRMPCDLEELADHPIARAIFDVMSSTRPSHSLLTKPGF